MMNKGISLRRLAEQGVKTIDNLKEAVNCYDDAAPIFKRERAELDYATTLVNKGNSLSILAEQGVKTIDNLKESVKCYDEAAPLFKREKAELDYALTLMNKGNSLQTLAEQGVEPERNFASAMKLYEKTEGIFLEKGSLINYAMAKTNHIIGLWWRFQETNEEKYLIQGRKLCKEARKVTPHITHPVREHINEMLIRIDDNLLDISKASKRELREERAKELALIVSEVMTKELAPLKKTVGKIDLRTIKIEKKLDEILDSIKIQTEEIINTIRQSGEKVSEEVARSFTSLADDLRKLGEEQQRKLLEELCRLLTDPAFQKNFIKESPPQKRSSIKSIFQRIREKASDIAGHMPAALVAHQIF